MKKYLILCVSLALISLTSCNESYEELDDVQQTAEQMSRKQLDDALSELSEIYDRNVVVVEMPTADNNETIAKVEEAMKSISDDKKEERYVVVSINDVFVSDIFDHLSIMSQRPEENIPSGSHTFSHGDIGIIPCDITVSWGSSGVGVVASDSFAVAQNNTYLHSMTSYYEIGGYFSITGCADTIGAYRKTFAISGHTNDDRSFEIHEFANMAIDVDTEPAVMP